MEAELFLLLAKKPPSNQPVARASYAGWTGGSGAIPWNTTDFALNGMTVSTSGITVPVSGYYDISGTVQYAPGTGTTDPLPAGSYAYVEITIGGVVYAKGNAIQLQTSSDLCCAVNDIAYISAGATVTITSVALSGMYVHGSTAGGDNKYTFMTATYVSS
jgi:hypothetical protein